MSIKLRNLLRPWKKSQRKPKPGEILFDGDSALFLREIQKSTCYGEYGMGLSTSSVLAHSQALIYSVDSAQEWVEAVRGRGAGSPRLCLNWVDVGPVGDWGTPKGYEKRSNFRAYAEWIWSHEIKPDLVLVDGRFRVFCFLTSLLRGNPGTRIIFDDYRDRGQYHIVEEFVRPSEWLGRQCMFVIPPNFDRKGVEMIIDKFEYVFD